MSEDRIRITGLNVQAHVGVTAEERAVPQPLVIHIDVIADLSTAGLSDDLGDSIDYDALSQEVADLVRAKEAKLLETVAHDIAGRICGKKGVLGVTVEVIKPSPPTVEDVREVGVKIERQP